MADLGLNHQLERLTAALAQRYVIEREVGQGGMATVYLARDLKHRRPVAVKVLHPELAAVIGRDRFLQEIEVAARLRHPHILPLHDSGDADGILYYVMPYVAGESLRDKLAREKQLDLDEALHYTAEIADALAYAHAQGVIHRDIKPANVMLDSRHAVVTDFGVALVAHAVGTGRMTGSGLSPGTPEYMSPEQACGSPDIDARSDIYALGCVAYEMLCGEPPFVGVNPQGLLARKLSEPPRGLRVVRPAIPHAVEQVILKALATTPADRFRSAPEFVQALSRAITTGIPPAGIPPRSSGEVSVPATTAAATPVARWVATGAVVLVVGGVLLTAIGLLATMTYDDKLQIPSQYTPSRLDFPLIGIRALIPALGQAFFVLVGFVLLRYVIRLLLLVLRRVRAVWARLDALGRRAGEGWQRMWQRIRPASLAESFFIASVVLSAIVLSRFWPLLSSLWSAATEPLSLASRPMHRGFSLALTILITVLLLAWRGLYRFLEGKSETGGTVRLAQWGGLGLIVVLVLIMTMPWRLLWDNQHPRALLGGEPVYILAERGSELLLYYPDRRVTEQYRPGQGPELVRQNSTGYLFEGAEAFAGRR
jgi:tRNA A-37 threonylcarbamoyl transferase component Bud32